MINLRVFNNKGHMQTIQSRVTSKGQIVIPKTIREKYGIRPKMVIYLILKEEGVLMIPDSGDPISNARGMLRNSGLLKKYIQAKREEKEKEAVKFARNK
jgi:AbrB family looped-hinge helix DNA binding protein